MENQGIESLGKRRPSFVIRVSKRVLRFILRRLGVDIVRYHASPHRTIIGLTEFDIGTVIDVGANTGQFARYISNVFPDAVVFCFEPLAEPYAALEDWAETQNGRVICRNVAVSDRSYRAEMYQHVYHSPSSSLLKATHLTHALYPKTRGERSIPMVVSTLDAEFTDVDLRAGGDLLLKLDVQGLEDRVLLGATRLLEFCIAVLLEVNLVPLYEGQADFANLVATLGQAGFKYAGNVAQSYDSIGRVVYIDALFLRD